MSHVRTALVVTFLLAAAQLFAADTFVIDKAHSAATFKIKHMMANVTGKFAAFSGTVNADRETPANSSVEFTIQAASITTNTPDRDKHLRSSDFFDVEKYPTITFKSVKIVPTKTPDTYNVSGDLTMHGVTKRITLPVVFNGIARDPGGSERAGFELNTTLNRKEYGITWNKTLDPGGFLLSDDVIITIDIEAVKK
ncbi:MAG: YceI family protein [Thermoanaerobaculia bacterium]